MDTVDNGDDYENVTDRQEEDQQGATGDENASAEAEDDEEGIAMPFDESYNYGSEASSQESPHPANASTATQPESAGFSATPHYYNEMTGCRPLPNVPDLFSMQQPLHPHLMDMATSILPHRGDQRQHQLQQQQQPWRTTALPSDTTRGGDYPNDSNFQRDRLISIIREALRIIGDDFDDEEEDERPPRREPR